MFFAACTRYFWILAASVQFGQSHIHDNGEDGPSPDIMLTQDVGDTMHHLRSMAETTLIPKDFIALQRKWHNWYACTDSYGNKSFVSTQYFAPEGYFFLSYAPTCTVTEKKGTVKPGTQTIVFPLENYRYVSWSNDWELGMCDVNTSAQAEAARYESANTRAAQTTNATNKAKLYSKIDGKDLDYFYVYDNGTYFFDECPGKELCGPDSCDANPFATCKGVDAFPLLGWWSTDTRTWKEGDTHTYEFGVLDKTEECSRTKYIITAESDDVCDGFFNIGILFNFCPLLWFLRFISKL